MSSTENSEILAIVKDMQKRMMYLEKKVDTLVAQSEGRESKPRPYGQRPQFSERKERSFDKKESGKSGFKKEKKPFYSGVKKPFKKK